MGFTIKEKLTAFLDWIDERTNAKSIFQALTKEPIVGGSRWAYTLGSGLLFALIFQFVSGILLLFYYVPSSDSAHISVAYIQKEVPFGNFIRGFHFHGTNFIVILTLLHTLRTFFWGAYKNKRELVWMSGLLLVFIILGFAFSGYLLPWDNNAYFGTNVRIGIMSSIPIIGEISSQIVLGGKTISTLTLSRFFTVHVGFLPLFLIGFTAIHLLTIFRAKHAGDYKSTTTENFYPNQFFKNSCFVLFLFISLILFSHLFPASLELQANPTDSKYIARPEWYFLFLFQLLKYFPGIFGLIPKMLLPGILFGAAFLLPFFDKNPERNPFKRPIASLSILLLLFGAITIALLAIREDQNNPTVKSQLEAQAKERSRFLSAPFVPQNIGKANAQEKPSNTPPPNIYLSKCSACHGDKAQGQFGPTLYNIAQKENRTKIDLIKLLKNPQSYNLSPAMPTFDNLSDQEYQELTNWLLSLKK